jgi:hypothetical protein
MVIMVLVFYDRSDVGHPCSGAHYIWVARGTI